MPIDVTPPYTEGDSRFALFSTVHQHSTQRNISSSDSFLPLTGALIIPTSTSYHALGNQYSLANIRHPLASPKKPSPYTTTRFIASTTLSVEDARKSILEDGFLCVEDPMVRGRVLEIAEKGSPLLSEEGLEFFKLNVPDDEVSNRGHGDGC